MDPCGNGDVVTRAWCENSVSSMRRFRSKWCLMIVQKRPRDDHKMWWMCSFEAMSSKWCLFCWLVVCMVRSYGLALFGSCHSYRLLKLYQSNVWYDLKFYILIHYFMEMCSEFDLYNETRLYFMQWIYLNFWLCGFA